MKVSDLFIGVEEMGESPPETYPEAFSDFLKDPDYEYELNADWKDLLMRIDFRGKRPSTKREWIELYLYLRRILSPEEDKGD